MVEQIILHIIATMIVVVAVVHLRHGLVSSTSWICLVVSITSIGPIVAYWLGLFGHEEFEWFVGMPLMTLILEIQVAGMVSLWCGHFLTKRGVVRAAILRKVPPIALPVKWINSRLLYCSLAGAALSVFLSTMGYNGYFTSREFLYDPPLWFDLVHKSVDLLSVLLFLLALGEYQDKGRLGIANTVLALAWIAAGFVSGFKYQVLVPGLYISTAAWISGNLRARHVLMLPVLLFFAYVVVEPLRAMRYESTHDNALEALIETINSSDRKFWDPPDVFVQFVRRLDSGDVSIRTLEATEAGGLQEIRAQIDNAYTNAFMLAVVPRALWAEKPLANLGAQLSFDVDENSGSSMMPSTNVMSYIWAGFTGVALNSFLLGIFMTIAGQLLVLYGRRPLNFFPVLILAFALSLGDTMMAYYYMSCLRNVVAVLLFYFLLSHSGIRMVQRPS